MYTEGLARQTRLLAGHCLAYFARRPCYLCHLLTLSECCECNLTAPRRPAGISQAFHESRITPFLALSQLPPPRGHARRRRKTLICCLAECLRHGSAWQRLRHSPR
ncbi:hypothetical protein BJY01DRAFT_20884 [Aspergillus pseudoustus]|uniref:Uncharacterized protein n=1 Tax=Aspergillus pseudoustus TaxID=1810923 RepID=A0ABR4JK61_9EURO